MAEDKKLGKRPPDLVWRKSLSVSAVMAGMAIVIFGPDRTADVFRCMALGLGLFNLVFAIRILTTNMQIAKRISGEAMYLLPVHIVIVAARDIVANLSLHIWVVARWSDGIHWYGLPFILVFDVLGVFGLRTIWQLQRSRMSHLDNIDDIKGEI